MNRRRVLLYLALSMLTAAASCKGKARQMTSDEATLVSRLEKSESTGHLDDMEVEYWMGGGLPPPYHRSDQLRFLVLEGREIVELNVETYDQERPNVRLVEYRMPLRPETLTKVAKLIRETGVFTRQYSEEDDPEVADILRIEIVLMNAARKQSATRRYYKRLPSALSALESEVEAIRDEVKRVGTQRLLDQEGHPIK